MRRLILIAMVVLMTASTVFAQDFCKGDFNYNGSVAAEDVTEFLNHFGRNPYHPNPCPPDGPTPVPKTGQTTSYATGDDGDLERGVALVTPRFTDNDDGTVTDNLTGLIWLKTPNCFASRTWNSALSDSNGLASGSCGLTDGSSAGEWRLPQIKELQSLIDFSNDYPALPSGHPFINVLPGAYWSSTTSSYHSAYAWHLGSISTGVVDYSDKNYFFYFWPVRGGH